MDFKIEMDVRIDDDEAHLMHFAPDTLRNALAGTKIVVDRISVTKKES